MSVRTDATPVVAEDETAPRPRAEAAAAALFPAAQHRAVTWRIVFLAGCAVVAGTFVGLGRTRGPGSFNSIWAEDASIVLTDALNMSFWHALTTPLNGY